jgi:hypothetical protein
MAYDKTLAIALIIGADVRTRPNTKRSSPISQISTPWGVMNTHPTTLRR